MRSSSKHVIVIGAGIVGAACAYYLHRAGLRVTVLDRGPVAGGATGVAEGHLLVSRQPPGPALDLARYSRARWREIGAQVGADAIELEANGSLAVAATAAQRQRFVDLVARLRTSGVEATDLDSDALAKHEPRLATGLAGGALFPEDGRVQPALAAARLLAASGADVQCGTGVRAIETGAGDTVRGVRTDRGSLVTAAVVVNATGESGGDLAGTVARWRPVESGHRLVLVTEPLAARRGQPPIRRTVYSPSPVPDTAAGDPSVADVDGAAMMAGLLVAATRSGPVLIGGRQARIEAAGSLPTLRRLAARAATLFPFLAEVQVIRVERGSHAYSPDRLPLIGPDPVLTGLFHACGHAGAGVLLAPATGALISALVTGDAAEVDPAPYSPGRFH